MRQRARGLRFTLKGLPALPSPDVASIAGIWSDLVQEPLPHLGFCVPINRESRRPIQLCKLTARRWQWRETDDAPLPVKLACDLSLPSLRRQPTSVGDPHFHRHGADTAAASRRTGARRFRSNSTEELSCSKNHLRTCRNRFVCTSLHGAQGRSNFPDDVLPATDHPSSAT